MESRTIKLNNGIEIDRVGLGFWEVRGAEAEKTLASAVEAGYRRIDTAMYYHNEEDVGVGIRVCGIPRKELFVASKIWYTDMCGGRQEETFYKSLEALGLDYIDLYYLHWPLGEVTESWKVLERLYEAGKIRAIGVCNFQPAHLQKLLAKANVCPAVDQIESNPCFQQSQAVAFCQKEGVAAGGVGTARKRKRSRRTASSGTGCEIRKDTGADRTALASAARSDRHTEICSSGASAPEPGCLGLYAGRGGHGEDVHPGYRKIKTRVSGGVSV